MIGCVLSAYFSFSAGYIYRHILSNINIYWNLFKRKEKKTEANNH
jgi:hypothetical protein